MVIDRNSFQKVSKGMKKIPSYLSSKKPILFF